MVPKKGKGNFNVTLIPCCYVVFAQYLKTRLNVQ